MKNYCFTIFISCALVFFGCSNQKTPDPKTQDSTKPVASQTTINTNQTLERQNIKLEQITKKVSPQVTTTHVSGLGVSTKKGQSLMSISGVQTHVSGQPNFSSNFSGSETHISGRIARPHFSGQ